MFNCNDTILMIGFYSDTSPILYTRRMTIKTFGKRQGTAVLADGTNAMFRLYPDQMEYFSRADDAERINSILQRSVEDWKDRQRGAIRCGVQPAIPGWETITLADFTILER